MFLVWCDSPQWARASSFTMFLHHTQEGTTVGRASLDEWSARRRDLYLTTHNTHNRQTTMSPDGIRTHDLSRRAAADLRFRPRGHWDRRHNVLHLYNKKNVLNMLSEHNYILSHRLVHTTTCFGPVYWPSSGCIINLISSYTVCAWVTLGGRDLEIPRVIHAHIL